MRKNEQNRINRVALILGSAIGLWTMNGYTDTIAYVSNAEDGIISRYKIDLDKGSLERLSSVKAGQTVMPLAISKDQKHLYAMIRSQPYQVITYAIKGKQGDLDKLASGPMPDNMAYISVDNTNKFLFGASYGQDLISVNPINDKGLMTDKALSIYKTDRHAHSIVVHPNNKFVYVANLGADKLLQYHLDQVTGKLTPIADGFVNAPKDSGPRHSVVAPNGNILYVINEMAGSVSSYAINQDTGALSLIETIQWPDASKYGLKPGFIRPMLGEPESDRDKTKSIWAADIKMTPNGKYLYTTERTSNSIIAYSIDTATGKLTYIDTFTVEKQPRGIAIDPSGRYLLASGQLDNKVGIYAIDDKTGKLRRIGDAATGKDGNWIEIINIQ